MRNFKRKTERGKISADVILRAARQVKKQWTVDQIRNVAAEFNINYRTLTWYCQKVSVEELTGENTVPRFSVGYQRNRQVFTDQQEQLLVEYLKKASYIYFGLSPKKRDRRRNQRKLFLLRVRMKRRSVLSARSHFLTAGQKEIY